MITGYRPLLSIGRRVRFRHVWGAIETCGLVPTRVLDAGCGDGRLASAMARRWPEAEVIALDNDPNTLDQARRQNSHLAVEWVRGEIGTAAVDGPFDLIVSTDVLEHITDDVDALKWFGESLAPTGRLVLHVPSSPQSHLFPSLVLSMRQEVASPDGPHVREGYSSVELAAIARAAGLEIVQLAWTFHRRPTRWAADIEGWAFLTHRRWVKLVGLPALLIACAAERRPTARVRGNGLLLVARRSASGSS